MNGSVQKTFYTHGEKFKWDLKFNMYNVANHLSISTVKVDGFNGVKLGAGNIFVSNTANWGAETATTPPRTMEASLRLRF